MSDVARKVFPMENVLALVIGKEDADVKELAGYLAGRTIACNCHAKVVAPLAAGWLASLYPNFVSMEWDEKVSWEEFVEITKKGIGDNVSVPPMGAKLQALVGKTIECLTDLDDTVKAQKSEIAALNAKVEVLEPAEAKAQELDKKVTQLEAKIKTMTTDMNGLRKELMPYQGKIAIDQAELMSTIKTAIKDNMKGFVAAGAGAAGAEGAADATADAFDDFADDTPRGITGEFGFNASGDDDDGFGF